MVQTSRTDVKLASESTPKVATSILKTFLLSNSLCFL